MKKLEQTDAGWLPTLSVIVWHSQPVAYYLFLKSWLPSEPHLEAAVSDYSAAWARDNHSWESKVLTVSPQLLAGNELKLTWKWVWWSLLCSLERDALW